MEIATITIDYDGRAWIAKLVTSHDAHHVGLCAYRRTRTSFASDGAVLGADGLAWLLENLSELVSELATHLDSDLNGVDRPETIELF